MCIYIYTHIYIYTYTGRERGLPPENWSTSNCETVQGHAAWVLGSKFLWNHHELDSSAPFPREFKELLLPVADIQS